MSDAEKKQFIDTYINTLRQNVVDKIYAMPENWEGAEIIAYVQYKASIGSFPLKGKRKRSFNNDLLIYPL